MSSACTARAIRSGVVEPMITLVMIGIVGLVAGSIFLPLFTLMSGVMG